MAKHKTTNASQVNGKAPVPPTTPAPMIGSFASPATQYFSAALRANKLPPDLKEKWQNKTLNNADLNKFYVESMKSRLNRPAT